MTGDANAVRRWAAEHAATVLGPAAAPADQQFPVPAVQAPRPTGPAVLASFTDIQQWETEGQAYGVGLTLTPDGRLLLAVGESDGALSIWDAATGDPLRRMTAQTTDLYVVSWGRDLTGRLLLAAAGSDATARVWDGETGDIVHVFPADAGTRFAHTKLAWGQLADASPVLAVASNMHVSVWHPGRSGSAPHRLHTGDLRTEALSLSWIRGSDGEPLLAIGDSGGNMWAWHASDWRRGPIVNTHRRGVRAITQATQADGRSLIATVSTSDTAIRLLTQAGSEFTFADNVNPAQGPLRTVTWIPLPDGQALLAGIGDHGLFLLDGHTWELLAARPMDQNGRGLHNLAWTLLPDGNLILASTSAPNRVHVWRVVLDPPAVPPPAPARAQPAQARERLVLPPRNVTPEFGDADASPANGNRGNTADSVAPFITADGRVLLATTSLGNAINLWDLATGRHLRALEGHDGYGYEAAWTCTAEGRLLLATASADRTARIWDPDTGECLQVLRGHGDRVLSAAWAPGQEGLPRLATAAEDATARIWDIRTGECLHTLYLGASPEPDELGTYAGVVTWALDPRGRPLLATGASDGTMKLWDPGTGECQQTLAGHNGWVSRIAWTQGAQGQSLLASACTDGTAKVWDLGTGECTRTIDTGKSEVRSVAWARTSAGPLLATGGEGTAQIWDPGTREPLASVPGPTLGQRVADWTRNRDGDLLLLVCTGTTGRPASPVEVWLVAEGGEQQPPVPVANGTGDALLTAGTTERLLRLGGGGLWPPLGLLADLVTVSGPQEPNGSATTPPHDPARAGLVAEPGVARLRRLTDGRPPWTPDARTAFAALLTSALDIPERYTPPPDASPAGLRDALSRALADRAGRGAAQPWHVPHAELRAAAATITEEIITLLAILGPAACAADPLLPVRLAHHAARLPALSPREIKLLAAAGSRAAHGTAAATGTLVWSPGTAGVTRTGPPTRLLPTELALPQDLRTTRLAASQLLYRQHRAPAPPAPQPVTIVLDTTPPTFGPAGNALRLAAHLVTATLWEHGVYPALVTLTEPRTITEVRTPAELIQLWVSATLDPPAAALDIALATAAGRGQPALLCTHDKTARERGYRPGPGSRLLTAHQPPEPAPPEPANAWHAHLPPEPAPALLASAIGRLLAAPATTPWQGASGRE